MTRAHQDDQQAATGSQVVVFDLDGTLVAGDCRRRTNTEQMRRSKSEHSTIGV